MLQISIAWPWWGIWICHASPLLEQGFLSQPESRRDDEPEKKTSLKEIWSRHHSYSGELWKTIKIRQVSGKPDFGSGSRLRVGKVLAPYSARPRAVPLIKNAKLMWFSKY